MEKKIANRIDWELQLVKKSSWGGKILTYKMQNV